MGWRSSSSWLGPEECQLRGDRLGPGLGAGGQWVAGRPGGPGTHAIPPALPLQTVMKFMAWLVHRGLSCAAEMTQFRVGHTHNHLDQRFAEMAEALKKLQRLDSPRDFADAILARVHGRQGRIVECELVAGALDWKTHFSGMPVAPHGHTQTHAMKVRNEEACHVFRFCRREALTEAASRTTSCSVTKLYLASPTVFQVLLFARSADFDRVPRAPQPPLPIQIEALAPKTVQEYKKTAAALRAPPWRMLAAAAFVEGLVKPPAAAVPPECLWVFSPKTREQLWPHSIALQDLQFGDPTPHPVTVTRATQPPPTACKAPGRGKSWPPGRPAGAAGARSSSDAAVPPPAAATAAALPRPPASATVAGPARAGGGPFKARQPLVGARERQHWVLEVQA